MREADARLVQAFMQKHNLPESVAHILAARGIDLEHADDFLSPSLRSSMPDPSHLLDMDVAAERVAAAIIAGETIGVFGDYDVDGATSSALLKRYFTALGITTLVHIPDRIVEGYGPNAPALLGLKDQGASLVITVDCGTLSFEPLQAAFDAGLDMIVVDHHQGEAKKPKALAIVNPNRMDEASECTYMAACGVGFMLMVAVNRQLRELGYFAGKREPDLRSYLDLVALGTVCDVVPLVGVNRAFVSQGLKVMAGRQNIGLRALMDVGGVEEAPSVYTAGFVLGPRINAGGRVGKSDLGVRLLTTDNEAEALAIAQELNHFNAERKTIEALVLEQAMAQAELQDAQHPVLLVSGEGWHPGVIGIVAGRIKERFHKPVAVIALDNGQGKASARSVSGFDFGAAVIAACEADVLIVGGGHAMAAGFTVDAAKLTELQAFLSARIQEPDALKARAKKLTVDARIGLSGATPSLLETLERVGPFGQGNPNIRMVLEGVKHVQPAIVGEHHVKTVLCDHMGKGRLSAIAFRAVGTQLEEALFESKGKLIDIACQLRINNWNGRVSVNVQIEDIALHQPSR